MSLFVREGLAIGQPEIPILAAASTSVLEPEVLIPTHETGDE